MSKDLLARLKSRRNGSPLDRLRLVHSEVTPLPEDAAPRSFAREALLGVVGLTVVGVLLGLAIALFEALR